MKARITHIYHPDHYYNPRIKVRFRGEQYTLDTYGKDHLYDVLNVGDEIEVKRQVNSPYMVLDK